MMPTGLFRCEIPDASARPVEPVRLLRFWPDHFSTIIVLIT